MYVFVSYRRDDTAGYAGRLHDDLTARLGTDRVFFDIDRIRAGADFEQAIKGAIDRSTAVLALIGPTWLSPTETGTRRIDGPADFVRLEIATALAAAKLVIPVLLGGARMPSKEQLPADIAPLAARQALTISHPRWRADVDELLAVLKGMHGSAGQHAGSFEDGIDPLIGRERDLASVLGELEHARLVTLTGTGGCGKTRLAAAAIDQLRDDGRPAWLVDLSAVEDSDLVGVTIMAALRLDGQSADPFDVISASIAGGEAVLALDNLEQVGDVGRPVTGLLRAAPTLRALATSRAPLGIRGEVEIAVQTLALPSGDSVEAIEASPAGALFLARARALGRLRTLDAPTAAEICELLRYLDGLPLAIELAAARTRAMTPGEIVRRLRREGLESLDKAGGDRHRSLRAILDWTLDLLTPSALRCLEAVSVCAGFDLELAEAVVADPEIDAVDAVESLVALGLVAIAPPVEGASRFRLLEPIREMLRQRLSAEQIGTFEDRLAVRILELAVDWEEQSLGGWRPGMIDRLDADADNIRRALDRLEATSPRQALALSSALEAFWMTRGRVAEGVARLERESAAAPEPSDELARALVLQIRIRDAYSGAVPPRAIQERIMEVARATGNRLALIVGLGSNLMEAAIAGDKVAAEALIAELAAIDVTSLGAHERIQRLFSICSADEALYGPYADETVEAQRAFLAEAEVSGRIGWRGVAAANLATVLRGRAEYEEAAELSRQAIVVFRDLERTSTLSWALSTLASCLADLGRMDEAIDAVLEGAAIAEGLRLDGISSDCLRAALPVAVGIGRPTFGAILWGAALGLSERGGASVQVVDQLAGERWLARAREAATAAEIDAAIEAGRKVDPEKLLRSLRTELRPIANTAGAGTGQT